MAVAVCARAGTGGGPPASGPAAVPADSAPPASDDERGAGRPSCVTGRRARAGPESCAGPRPSPADGSRTNGAAHPHTAHESSPAIIHYRHHPFHGEPVTIVRRLRRYTADCVVIQLADDVQVAVPTWMLDPLACQQLTDEEHPRLAVTALCELRALLDCQPVVVALTTTINAEGSQQTGGDDARPDRASTGTTDADVRSTRTVADAPGAGSRAVPRSAGTTTESRASRRGTHKERG